MATSPVRFEIDDTVRLRGNDAEPDLFGRVERTYDAVDSHEPVEDCLILAYVLVDPDIFKQFITSGRPPRGYLFVEFAHEEDGHALLPEESVTLVSRALSTGETVKQRANTAMFGTIIDVQSRYSIIPTFQPLDNSISPGVGPQYQVSLVPSTDDIWPIYTTSHFNLQTSPYEVNGDDLRRAEDYRSGDHVVSLDWFGLVESSDLDVAILLDNMTILWVERPWELEIVVINSRDKPLVSMPELDGIRRPDILNVNRNGIVSMPSKRLGCGDKVVTNRRNLEKGRWLVGEYDPDVLPQGVVLDVRTRNLKMDWLVQDPFRKATTAIPPNVIRAYENLTSFRDPRELRARKDLTRYDHHRKPVTPEAMSSSVQVVSSGDVYCPGDRVRFRSPRHGQHPKATKIGDLDGQRDGGESGSSSGSRVTDEVHDDYGGPVDTCKNDNLRPRFIPRAETFEFDLNEYMICWGNHTVVVLWQDGTESTMTSTELTPYSLPEIDPCPGDLVMAKEGMAMIGLDAAGALVTSDFNEMSFFERDHVLQPAKIGVIQSVDGQERLASVRWYGDPHIRLSAFGQVLKDARFGEIGDLREDVSSYEIMKAPVLVRKLGDFVVIRHPTQEVDPSHIFAAIPGDSLQPTVPPGPTTLSYLLQTSSQFPAISVGTALPFARWVDAEPASTRYGWLGEIIGLGLDGTVTVRLGGLKDCQDVRISHEHILLIVDDDVVFPSLDDNMNGSDDGGNSLSMWEDDGGHYHSDQESAIDEVVEYEGGERLDNESGEDEWSTDEDTPDSFVDAKKTNDKDDSRDVEMGGTGSREVEPEDAVAEDDENSSGAKATEASNTSTSLSADRNTRASTALGISLTSVSNSTLPVDFEVLEQYPPPDQFQREEAPTQNPAFLKRIAKEHRILASSLPAGEIYIRTYESRLDLLRCLIVGPADTPYEYCPFVVDLHLGPDFPKEPPRAHFHSWTSGLGRINPNLYEEGKICLSLLGTWPGQSKQEGWSESATILQLLVSLQGLVFVSSPFYNEAGFETYSEEKLYSLESLQYSEKAYVMARGFVKYALQKAPGGLEGVLAWLYLCVSEDGADSQRSPRLLRKVIQRAKLLMVRSAELKQHDLGDAAASVLVDGVGDSADSTKTFLKPLSKGAAVMLRKIVLTLEETLQRYE